MRTVRPIAPVSLANDEREALERWARRPKSAQALAQRARIILECASDRPNTTVAQGLGVTPQTVGKWRQRFLERRLAGLLDEPRPGAPRQVGDAQIERVVRMTLERARGRHALEHARDGQALRLEPEHGEPHLAGLCAAAASSRGLQAFQRPAVHRESARYRRALPPSARPCAGVVRRREEPDPGTRSQSAAVADAPRPG